ncbi:MAG: insulinase family protein [Phycisphaerales bacterium]|nr:insulinase family protein [Phycisphaerales bacterium]
MPHIERFDLACGMPLLVERHDTASSVALTWLLPLGSASDEPGRIGASTVLAEWLWRGAGDLDSRGLSDALDRCGVQRSSHVGGRHLSISATLIGSRLAEALPILASVVTRPRFEDASFEAVRDLTLQSIEGLHDEHQQRTMLLARRHFFPEPFNRSGYGEADDVKQLAPEAARQAWSQWARPGGSILALAGDVDGAAVAKQLDELLSGWSGGTVEPKPQAWPAPGMHHEPETIAQVHIAVAAPAPPEPDANNMKQRIATAVLSGGMSGRLFTEVREKRSLCYSVHASYAAGRDFGAIFAYSGTTAERAQETLDVLIAELERVHSGVDESEFARAVVGLKSRLVMQGESTSARASSLAHDLYNRGAARTLDEVRDQVDAVTLEDVNAYLAGRSAGPFTIVTLGPKGLTRREV